MRTAVKDQARGDKIAELSSRIKEEILAGRAPGDKLLPERKLAQRLGTTQNRAHRAVQLLVEEGLLRTKGGGWDIRQPSRGAAERRRHLGAWQRRLRHHGHHAPQPVPEAPGVDPRGGQRHPAGLLAESPGRLQRQQPVRPSGGGLRPAVRAGGSDVFFTSVHGLRQGAHPVQELDIGRLEEFGFDERELCPGVCEPCRATGRLLGVPALRIQSGLWANLDLCRRHGVELDALREPGDIFAAAALVERQSKGADVGTNYCGYHWHAGNYGFDIRRRQGQA